MRAGTLVAGGVGALAVLTVVYVSLRDGPEDAVHCGPEGRYVLARAKAVVPSTYGDGADPASQVWLRGAWTPASPTTSCGPFVAYALEGRVNTRNGTGQVQIEGERLGIWHDYVPGGPQPCPGSAYALVRPGAQHVPGEIVHVGIWDHDGQTVDGGQGGHDASQGATECARTFDPATGLITYLGQTRELSGWLDVDGL